MASSSSNGNNAHHVFISFRGEDTRNTFTSHLNAALKRVDIKTYIDNNLKRGDEISARLVRAIEESKLSIIVFSKNFASSRWCLDEVVKILECKKKIKQIVVPIFYQVDPSIVRNQRETYAEAFANHEHVFQGDMNKVQKWREALTKAANLSGWECSGNRMESEIVEEIAMDVLQKLDNVYVGDLDRLIAKYEQLAELQEEYSVDYSSQQATLKRVNQLKLERGIRLLRLPSDSE